MKSNSIKAYFDETNQKAFNRHRAIIYRYLFNQTVPQSRRMIAEGTGLTEIQIVRRLSEMQNSNEIEYCGNVTEGKNENSLYKVKDQISMFPVQKKKTRIEKHIEAVENCIFKSDEIIERFKEAGNENVVSNQLAKRTAFLECLNILKTIK